MEIKPYQAYRVGLFEKVIEDQITMANVPVLHIIDDNIESTSPACKNVRCKFQP